MNLWARVQFPQVQIPTTLISQDITMFLAANIKKLVDSSIFIIYPHPLQDYMCLDSVIHQRHQAENEIFILRICRRLLQKYNLKKYHSEIKFLDHMLNLASATTTSEIRTDSIFVFLIAGPKSCKCLVTSPGMMINVSRKSVHVCTLVGG